MDRLAERTAPTEGVRFPLSLTMADWWAVSLCLYFPASLSHLFPLYSSFCQYETEISAGVTTTICPGHESGGRVYGTAVFHQPLHLHALIWGPADARVGAEFSLASVDESHREINLEREWCCVWERRFSLSISLHFYCIFTQKEMSSSKPHCYCISMAKSNILMGASILFYKHRMVSISVTVPLRPCRCMFADKEACFLGYSMKLSSAEQ